MGNKSSPTTDGHQAVPDPVALMESHSVLREVMARHERLKMELAGANRTVQELLGRGAPSARKSRAEELAEAVAAAGTANAAAEVPESDEGYKRDLNLAMDRRRVLQKAVEITERNLTQARYAAAQEVAEKLLPHYSKLVAVVAAKVVELSPLIEQEVEFRARVHDAGIPLEYIGSQPMARLGVPRDRNGYIRAWLQGCVERGHIRESDIPAEWRRVWHAAQDRNGKLVFDD